jgi:hypothetical protein
MSYDWKFAFVRFVNHGADFVHRHLVLVNQLDAVDSGFGQAADFRSRVVNSIHAPAE